MGVVGWVGNAHDRGIHRRKGLGKGTQPVLIQHTASNTPGKARPGQGCTASGTTPQEEGRADCTVTTAAENTARSKKKAHITRVIFLLQGYDKNRNRTPIQQYYY